MFYISNLNGYIRPCRRVLVFGAFLKPTTQLQRTRSRRPLNRFWCFLVQNKVESLLVLFLLFQAHFCWDESNENVQWSKKLRFFLLTFLCSPSPTSHVGNPWGHRYRYGKYRNMQYWDIPSPHFFLVTFQVGGLQVSAQTEHSAMWSSWAKKSSQRTRNGNAYWGAGTAGTGIAFLTQNVCSCPAFPRWSRSFLKWSRCLDSHSKLLGLGRRSRTASVRIQCA